MGFLGFLFSADQSMDSKQRQLEAAITEAIKDGKLDAAEADAIYQLAHSLGLSQSRVSEAKRSVFSVEADRAMKDGHLTDEESAALDQLQAALGLGDSEIKRTRGDLDRLRRLSLVRDGVLPEIEVIGLVMKKGEVVHWAQPGGLLETKVTKKRWEGGYSGFSVRIVQGVTWRIGGTRGHFVPVTETLVTSTGWLLITNRRVVFRGDRKSFQYDWDQLLEYGMYTDGVRLTPERGEPKLVKFSDTEADADTIGTVIATAISRYEGNLFDR